MPQRYTDQPNQNILEVPPHQMWVGIIDQPAPHIALATCGSDEDGDDLRLVFRLSADEATQMAGELMRLANTLAAPNN